MVKHFQKLAFAFAALQGSHAAGGFMVSSWSGCDCCEGSQPKSRLHDKPAHSEEPEIAKN
jgi:hypothetical protein